MENAKTIWDELKLPRDHAAAAVARLFARRLGRRLGDLRPPRREGRVGGQRPRHLRPPPRRRHAGDPGARCRGEEEVMRPAGNWIVGLAVALFAVTAAGPMPAPARRRSRTPSRMIRLRSRDRAAHQAPGGDRRARSIRAQQVIAELREEKRKIREAVKAGVEVLGTEVDAEYARMARRMDQTVAQMKRESRAEGRCPETLKHICTPTSPGSGIKRAASRRSRPRYASAAPSPPSSRQPASICVSIVCRFWDGAVMQANWVRAAPSWLPRPSSLPRCRESLRRSKTSLAREHDFRS